MTCSTVGCTRTLDRRNSTGRCRYHPLPRTVAVSRVRPARGERPDAGDQRAVNMWLREVAVAALADHLDAGPVSPRTFEAFRRSILTLQEESRLLEPAEVTGDTVLDEIAGRLNAINRG